MAFDPCSGLFIVLRWSLRHGLRCVGLGRAPAQDNKAQVCKDALARNQLALPWDTRPCASPALVIGNDLILIMVVRAPLKTAHEDSLTDHIRTRALVPCRPPSRWSSLQQAFLGRLSLFRPAEVSYS